MSRHRFLRTLAAFVVLAVAWALTGAGPAEAKRPAGAVALVPVDQEQAGQSLNQPNNGGGLKRLPPAAMGRFSLSDVPACKGRR